MLNVFFLAVNEYGESGTKFSLNKVTNFVRSLVNSHLRNE